MWRLVFRVALVVVLATVAISAGRYAIADYYFERAKNSFDASDFSRYEYARELQPFIKQVNIALKWRRKHADALDFKANLLYQSWWLSPDGQYLHQSALLKNAVELHSESMKLRRNWAFSSARLALIYSHQAKLDKEFDRWFVESHRLGLYETSIARSLMVIGLQNWSRLSKPQQGLTIDFVRTSIEQKANSPKAMTMILDRYGKRTEVCLNVPKTPRATKVCAKLERNIQSSRVDTSTEF